VVPLLTVLASRRSAVPRALDPDRGAWGTALDVPERSQMIYPGGGAGSSGATVSHFSSIEQIERWIAAGVPMIASLG
jgi:hypothetical protein